MPRILIALLSLVLITAACGGDEPEETTTTEPEATTTTAEPETTTSTTIADTTTTVLAGPASPLNGLPVKDATLLNQRVMAVKIDNHPNARPQSGIEQADAVWELLVEGGLTRFIALFHQTDVDYLGPIRSGRPTDPTLAAITSDSIVISGAQDWVQSIIRSKGLKIIGEVRPGTFRVSHRSAPHNLYGDTVALRDHAAAIGVSDEGPNQPLFTWGPLDDASAATEIIFDWSGFQSPITWKYQGGQYLRFNGANAHTWTNRDRDVEEQISADTLVVLESRFYTACPSGSGSCVPALDTVGNGRALVFHGGEVQEGTWARGTHDIPFALTDADGSVLEVPAGRMWMMAFPAGRPIDW